MPGCSQSWAQNRTLTLSRFVRSNSQSFSCWTVVLAFLLGCKTLNAQINLLERLNSPVIFMGDDTTAYRDPAVLYHDGNFYLFYTLVKTENNLIYSYTAYSRSGDLLEWSDPKIITIRDQSLNFCSPGNVIQFNNEWILCLQSYPRPGLRASDATRYGSKDARIFIMRSKDLEHWSSPELLHVKGPDVKEVQMGRMIDPYVVQDKDELDKWWCFYKQNGVSMSYSYDLQNWNFFGHTESGENVCVWTAHDEYFLMHSPSNGIGIKRSSDLQNWNDWGDLITLGQSEWEWAKGRITAGAMIDLRVDPNFGKYILFFHGSGPKTETEGDFDRNASIGIAWSEDLLTWDWPGK